MHPDFTLTAPSTWTASPLTQAPRQGSPGGPSSPTLAVLSLCPPVKRPTPLGTGGSPARAAHHCVLSARWSAWHEVRALRVCAGCTREATATPRPRPQGPLCPYLDAGVTTQVEVELGGVRDLRVHGGACWNVPAFPDLRQHGSPSEPAEGSRPRGPLAARLPSLYVGRHVCSGL